MKLPSKTVRLHVLGLTTAGTTGLSAAFATHSLWALGFTLPLSWLIGVETARNIERQRKNEYMMKMITELQKELSK